VREHTVKSYHEELARLKSKIITMGKDTESQLSQAVKALSDKDIALSETIVHKDGRVNILYNEIDHLTVRILALRQPMAVDLRGIIAGLKIAGDLERTADYAANIAKHVPMLTHISFDLPLKSINQMAGIARTMLNDIITAYANSDIRTAVDVWHRDDEIDQIYAGLLTQLRHYMTQDSKNVDPYTNLLFVARCCERIGDHITNIAENVHFIEYGKSYCGSRKSDQKGSD
jgi:phosphate transport system protein